MPECGARASRPHLTMLACLLVTLAAADTPLLRGFQLATPLCRAGRPADLVAKLANPGPTAATVPLRLSLPPELTLVAGRGETSVTLEPDGEATVTWRVQASASGRCEVRLTVAENATTLPLLVLPAQTPTQSYIPAPQPVRTPLLLGAHHCPLWEADKPQMWSQLLKHPERTPALGCYDQANPEVSDWETKWAVEHGIGFFIYCWYRNGQGGPVKTNFSSQLDAGLFKSRYESALKWTIMWENQSRGRAGVANEADLFDNLLPFWLDNYFKRDSYLKVDGKPVLFIYRPEFLVQDLGSEAAVRAAFDRMRAKCVEAGYKGLYLLGEYRGLDPKHLQLMQRLGLDYTFAYCWYVPNNPTPAQAIAAQQRAIGRTQELGMLPQVVTVSQAWSGWRDEGTIWKLPPDKFGELLGWAKEFVGLLPKDQLGSRMLLLDNWNEWGEGHYIAPYREHGFGYLDAVRQVFAPDAPQPHVDLLPEDLGLGPYDTAYRTWTEREERSRKLVRRLVTRPGAEAAGLVGWWTFDEADGEPVALDYSGHRLGGTVESATRAPGRDGRALVCDGGSVIVPSDPSLSLTKAFSVECWVKTEVPRQDQGWLVNRIFGGGELTGYRLGLLGGRACFQVPVTAWSHHLTAEQPLPLGRWVHLCGTFDGATMRLYVDGALAGSLARPEPVRGSNFHLCLGNFELGHAAHFRGLLDDVKLWNRALDPTELAAHAGR